MHSEARAWIERTVARWDLPQHALVLDVGGRNVNGTPIDLFPGAGYVAADIEFEQDSFTDPSSETFRVIWDATRPADFRIERIGTEWRFTAPATPAPTCDVVLTTETLEHVKQWPEIVRNCGALLKPGGRFLCTAATDPRQPHSGVDGWELRPDEWYANVDPDQLAACALEVLEEVHLDVDRTHGDVYLWGIR